MSVSKTGLIGVIGGVILVIALGLSYWLSQDQESEIAAPPAPETTTEPETDTSVSVEPNDDGGANDQAEGTQDAPPQVVLQNQTNSDPNAPSFDVVRVSPDGDSVFAGRAPAGSKVTIFSDGEPIGEVEADSRGEWVFLPEKPLAPGSHELSLTAEPVQVAAETAPVTAPITEPVADNTPSQTAAEPTTESPQGAEDGPASAPAPANTTEPKSEATKAEAVQSEDVVVLVVPEQGQDIGGTPSREPVQPLAVLTPRDGEGASRVLQKPLVTPGGVEAETGALALDSVDYDQDGNLALRGRAAPNALVRIYLDNALIGEAKATSSGEWVLQPQAPVAPGVYELRADQIQDAVVTSRLSLPFSRAEPILTAGNEQLIVVQPGNSLWRIARRTLGDGLAYTVIYEANKNQIGDPDLIYPGQIFSVPEGSLN